MAIYTLTDTGNVNTNGLYLLDILEGTNNSGYNSGLNQVVGGDTVKLEAGVTYQISRSRGLPLYALGSALQTTITTTGTLPDSNTRLKPTVHGAQLALLRNTVNNGTVVMAERGAKNWTLTGLDITTNITSQTAVTDKLIDIGLVDVVTGNYCTVAEQLTMDGFVIEHCFIHDPQVTWSNPDNDTLYSKTLRGIYIQGGATIRSNYICGLAVKSYYSPTTTLETYAILSTNSPLPVVVDNNYLEASFAVIFWGGSGGGPATERTVTAASMIDAEAGTGTITLDSVAGLSVDDWFAVESPIKVSGSKPYQQAWNVGRVTAIDGLVVTYQGQEHRKDSVGYAAPVVGCVIGFSTGSPGGGTAVVQADPAPTSTTATVDDASDISIGSLIILGVPSAGTGPTDGLGGGRPVHEVTNKSGNDLTFTFVKRGLSLVYDSPLVGAVCRYGGYTTPRQWTVTRNRMQNRLAWAAAGGWQVKWAGFECKSMDTMLCEGNLIYSYGWDDGGDGEPYVTPGVGMALRYNQVGDCPWSNVKNITFQYNWVLGAGATSTGSIHLKVDDHLCITGPDGAGPFYIRHNVFEEVPGREGPGMRALDCSGSDRGVAINGVEFIHNTHVGAGGSAAWTNHPTISATGVIKDNVMCVGPYGLACAIPTGSVGNPIANCWPSATMTYNLLVDTDNVYPHANWWPSGTGNEEVATWAGAKFVNLSGRDYRLAPDSPGYQAASDAPLDMGVDFATMQTKMNPDDWALIASWSTSTSPGIALRLGHRCARRREGLGAVLVTGHPLAIGLRSFALFGPAHGSGSDNFVHELIGWMNARWIARTGGTPWNPGNLSRVDGRYGAGLYLPVRADTAHVRVGTLVVPGSYAVASGFIILADDRIDYTTYYMGDKGTTTGKGVQLWRHYADSNKIKLRFGDGTSDNDIDTGLAPTAKQVYVLGWSIRPGEQVIYIDGVVAGTASVATTELGGSSSGWINYLMYGFSAGGDFQGTVWAAGWWDRFLTASDHQWLYERPFDVIASPGFLGGIVPVGTSAVAAAGGGIHLPLIGVG